MLIEIVIDYFKIHKMNKGMKGLYYVKYCLIRVKVVCVVYTNN